MPSTRESRIARLASSDQRWAIGSPARWTTASRPASASAGAGSESGSAQPTASTPRLSDAFPGERDSAVTSSPRSTSARTSALPTSPVAPVTATFNVIDLLVGS